MPERTTAKASSGETYSFWELMGATTGPTRGEMAHRVDTMGKNGWELSASLASVGSTGHWPHTMAIFRLADTQALVDRLDAGFADGMDERDLRWTSTKLARRVRGEFKPKHRAYLFESLRCESADALRGHTGPDLVFSEVFAPWQGFALWGAASLDALAERERKGVGSRGRPGIVQATGWWVVVAERAFV